MHIGIVGINHKVADIALREKIATACLAIFGATAKFSWPFVLLSTCNRTEIYFAARDLAAVHQEILHLLRKDIAQEFEQRLYAFFGFDCFLHLAKVTAGLDSAIVGESEIQGQVVQAYEVGKQYRPLSKPLHFLFQKALQTGKQVRSRFFSTNTPLPDLRSCVYKVAEQHLGQCKNCSLLFVGASRINNTLAQFVQQKGIGTMAMLNRSEAKGRDMAHSLGCQFLRWDQLHHWHEYDWVICATKSHEYLISHATSYATACKEKLLVDLAVPRNIDPICGDVPNWRLHNLDSLSKLIGEERSSLEHAIANATAFVAHTVQQKYRTMCAQ